MFDIDSNPVQNMPRYNSNGIEVCTNSYPKTNQKLLILFYNFCPESNKRTFKSLK